VITAVDTNVLIDVFTADPAFGIASLEAVSQCTLEGRLVATDVVWAELAAVFPDAGAATAALDALGVDFSPVERPTAEAAGGAWRSYRAGGGSRTRLAADFLIGAHASHQADRLLSRDRGFYRKYFTGLEILDPSPTG